MNQYKYLNTFAKSLELYFVIAKRFTTSNQLSISFFSLIRKEKILKCVLVSDLKKLSSGSFCWPIKLFRFKRRLKIYIFSTIMNLAINLRKITM